MSSVNEPLQIDTPYVVFVVFQTGRLANGGVESITQVIGRCRQVKPVVVTQRETGVTQRWRSAGIRVEVWPFENSEPAKATTAGLTIQSEQNLTFWQQFRSHWQTNWRMYQLLRSLPCTVVHCNDHRSLWQTALGAKLAGAKVIFNIRDMKTPEESYDWRWQMAAQLSDYHLLLSQAMRQQWIDRLNIPVNRQTSVHAIYSVVDFNQFRPVDGEQRRQIRSALQIPEDGIALGYVATFNPKKAQLNFLERAVPLLREKLPQVKFYFIGDFDPAHDSYARSCQQAVQRLGLEDCVRFVGFVAQVARWYQALDLTVVASRREGLARCMIESLACGTPVISFEVCSAREILVEYQCGEVFPQGDYGDLVEAIVQFGQNPPLREQWRSAGIQTARLLFQPQAVVEQYEALYLSSMASKPIMHYAN